MIRKASYAIRELLAEKTSGSRRNVEHWRFSVGSTAALFVEAGATG